MDLFVKKNLRIENLVLSGAPEKVAWQRQIYWATAAKVEARQIEGFDEIVYYKIYKAIAQSLLNILDNINTPCSVKAIGISRSSWFWGHNLWPQI